MTESTNEWDVIGLDLSLTSTGVAIGDDTYVVAPQKLTGPERLQFFRTKIHELVAMRMYDVGPRIFVAIEGYSFASRHSHAHALGELGGVMRLWFYDHQIPYVDIPPTSRAKFATGKGNAGKSEVVSAISARTGIFWDGPGNDDRCDAWVLQEMGLTHFGRERYNWPATHRDALSKIAWPTLIGGEE